MRRRVVVSDILQLRPGHRLKRIERIDARVMAVAESHAKRVVSDAPDPGQADIERHIFRVQQPLAAYLVPALRTLAGKAQITVGQTAVRAVGPLQKQRAIRVVQHGEAVTRPAFCDWCRRGFSRAIGQRPGKGRCDSGDITFTP